MKSIDENTELLQALHNEATRSEAFTRLMQKYGRTLYWHIRRIVVGHDDAEDVMQETSIKIYTKIGSFKGESALSTWLYRVATNEALSHLRSKTHLFQSIDSLGDTLASQLTTECNVDSSTTEVLMQKALLTLPTAQRVAFNLRYYDELPYEQIAQITGKSESSLKTNYHFAVAKIKKYLTDNAI